MVVDVEIETEEKIWITFLRNHWKMVVLFVLAAFIALVGAILVFLWFVEEAQMTGLVPPTLGLWAISHIISFILHLLFWEILYIGIPIIVFVVIIIFLWWKKLPLDEREEYKNRDLFGSGSSNSDKSGMFSFLLFIAFIIKIYLDGNWNVAIASWAFDYVAYSFLWVFIWIAVLIGIPVSIGLIWWAHHEINKNS